MSSKLKGLRVAMLCEGSRGDCQPYIALAQELQAQGCVIKILTNSNHETMIKDSGLNFAPVYSNSERMLVEEPSLREAMVTGNVFSFLDAYNEIDNKVFPDTFKLAWMALEQFKPQLILFGILSVALTRIYSTTYNIPAISVNLQVMFHTGELPPLGMSIPAFSFLHRAAWWLVFKSYVDGFKKKYAVAKNYLGSDEFMKTVPTTASELIEEINHPIAPTLIGCSSLVNTIPTDVTDPNIHCTGFWVMSQQQQTERFMAGDPNFGGTQRAEIEEFMKAGTQPVYVGWGSMIAVSPKFMTHLAVSALKAAGRRGVILRGWAQLDPGLLDEQDLIDYAKANTLFIKTAPHEWLMPQCAMNVIHGGSGSTAASMRSGKPTIITPVWLDQHDFANSVRRLGNGVATCLFKDVTTETLADAINKCTADPEILKSASEVAAKLKAENGVESAAQKIKDFVEGPMANGEWRRNFDRARAARRRAHEPMASRFSCW